MDSYELAKKWLSENELRFHHAMMDSDEIALAGFCAGFEAAQQSLTGLMCPFCNGSEMIDGKCRNCGVDGTPRK